MSLKAIRRGIEIGVALTSIMIFSGCATIFDEYTTGYFPAPEYPADALAKKLQGEVTLGVEVGADGLPTSVVVEKSGGDPILDEAAVNAVRTWRWPRGKAGHYSFPLGFKIH